MTVLLTLIAPLDQPMETAGVPTADEHITISAERSHPNAAGDESCAFHRGYGTDARPSALWEKACYQDAVNGGEAAGADLSSQNKGA